VSGPESEVRYSKSDLRPDAGTIPKYARQGDKRMVQQDRRRRTKRMTTTKMHRQRQRQRKRKRSRRCKLAGNVATLVVMIGVAREHAKKAVRRRGKKR